MIGKIQGLKTLIMWGVLMELLYLAFYFVPSGQPSVAWFTTVHIFGWALLLIRFVFVKTPSEHVIGRWLYVVIGFGIVFRLTLVPHDIVASDDIFRYVWDGRVGLSGENPYRYTPIDRAVAHLQTEDLPARINHPEMRTIYPPLAQVFFMVSNFLFGPSVSGMKLLFVLFDLLTMVILVRLLRQRNSSPNVLLLYAWSPLPVLYIGLDGHLDALGISFLLMFLLFVSGKKPVQSAFALGSATLAKLYPLMVAPFLFWEEKGWRRIALVLIPVMMLVAGTLFYIEPTGGLIESFLVFSSSFEFNGSIFKVLLSLLHSNELAHNISAMLLFLTLVAVFFLRRPILDKVFLAFLAFIVCSASVQPWYLLWLNALLVVRWSRAVFVLIGTVGLSNLVVYDYVGSGVWADQQWILLVEYIPFFILLIPELVTSLRHKTDV